MADKDIDLWFEALAATEDTYQRYWALLDKEEQAKALRFVQEQHRARYVISHGKVRTILARYIDKPPETLCFAQEVAGKPYLVVDGRPHEVKFNLSHSGDRMMLAVSRHEPVGVDIEVWLDGFDCAAVAEECFTETEKAFWQALPAHEKADAFYRFWTRKESFVKAIGAGISLDVSQVVTSVDGASRFISLPARYGAAGQWRLVDLDLGPGLSGALTVRAGGMERLCFRRL
ncbi:4'-phosphopantetheinyl transferase family protein [Methylobacter marinus]|uniref:4'-phosphopantetheinyl transferase family protein n=1 Tax=Methylobacter marinus TaxID=34058 RepID=UPI00036DA61A|nr:4'-phosphopantetheinyl transferase superfamily protein [Methylobacter marinus]